MDTNRDVPLGGFDEVVLRAIGLAADEKIAGFLYFGTPTDEVSDRPRPEPDALLTRFEGIS